MRIIMHIDVNNAFLSWSAVYYLLKGSKIDLRETCAVISGDPKKRSGVVLAKSPLAKKMGVVSGESLYLAKRKCSDLKSYPPNFKFYKYMSNKLFEIITKYTPDIEKASIDECYLDFTPISHMYNSPLDFAKMLQNEIYRTLKFTVNIGIANNKLCAKMASDFAKPNKIHTLYENEIEEKMWPLPIDDLFGVGKKSAAKLHNINIHTIKDLANTEPVRLYPFFKNQSKYLIDIANGKDESIVFSGDYEFKGISNEITLEKDSDDIKELSKYLLYLSDKISNRLRKENKYAFVVAVIIKTTSFKRKTKQIKLKNATNSSKEIYEVSKKILKTMIDFDGIRLIGIRLDELTTINEKQIDLFSSINSNEKEEKLDKTVDNLKEKYGISIIKNGIYAE